MKTATVPNSPEITTLMEVSAELTLSLEQYEKTCREGIVRSMHDSVAGAVDRAMTLNKDFTEKDLKLIEAVVADAVHQACDYQSRYIQIHERSLGLTAATAPAENAVVAVNTFAQQTATYWEQVNG